MKLQPFVGVDETDFSASRSDITSLKGEPLREGRNDVGLNELDYGDVVYRFQDGGRLEEITQEASVLLMGNVAVPFDTLASFIREHDGAAFERAGFLVSPEIGLAFDPKDPCWVTAIAKHCVIHGRRFEKASRKPRTGPGYCRSLRARSTGDADCRACSSVSFACSMPVAHTSAI
jgi:hypothetical protein